MKSFALILFLTFTLFAEAKNCAVYLAENHIMVSEDPTENLIAFLSELYKKQTLNEQSISKIANGDFENPLKAKVSSESDHQIFFEVYEDLLSQAIDRNKLQKWAANFVKVEQKTTEEKNESKQKTKSFRLETFLRVEDGQFTINAVKKKYDVTLTTPFEMTATHITQGFWEEVMGQRVNNMMSAVHPVHPVTEITWWSAIEFANRLSKNSGLPEVYDTSGIKKWTGRAESGDLEPQVEADGAKLKINAPGGNIYKAKGYRLPTIYEHLYVISDRGRSNTKTFSNIDEKNIGKYAACGTFKPIQEVAGLKPFILDNQFFYDLYGNVQEMLHSQGFNDEELISGVDPVDTVPTPERAAVRIAARLQSRKISLLRPEKANNHEFTSFLSHNVSPRMSFRLVRSLEK